MGFGNPGSGGAGGAGGLDPRPASGGVSGSGGRQAAGPAFGFGSGSSSGGGPAGGGGSSGGRRERRRTVGPYQLVAQHGQGRHGPVYLARLPGNDASFTLKLFPPNLPPEDVSRVRQEVQAVTRLDHPGLVRPIDVGMDKSSLYVVSEHVPGVSLQEHLSKNGPCESAEAAQHVATVADALAAAHEAGLVHGDLRPGCVILDERDGMPRLADLGLGSLPRGAERSSFSARPLYRAPELLDEGERPDVKSDVYGLGAVLYELLTCAPPFEGRSGDDLSEAIKSGRPTRPRDLVPDVDPRIERLCLRAMSVARRRRPRSARALAQQLRRVIGAGGGTSSLTVGLVVLAWLVTLAVPAAWALRERRQRHTETGRLEAELARSQAAVSSKTHELQRSLAQRAELEQSASRLKEERNKAWRGRDQVQRQLNEAQSRAQQLIQNATRQASALRDALVAEVARPSPAAPALLGLANDLPAPKRIRLLISLGQFGAAEQVTKAALAAAPDDPEVLVAALAFHSETGEREELSRLLARLKQAYPVDTPYGFYARWPERAESMTRFDELLQLMEEGRQAAQGRAFVLLPMARVAFSQAFQQQGQIQQQLIVNAGRMLDAVLEAEPLNVSALLTRSQLRWQTSTSDEDEQQRRQRLTLAWRDLRLAIALRPHAGYGIIAARRWLELGQPWPAWAEAFAEQQRADQKGALRLRIQARVWIGNAAAAARQEEGAVAAWGEAMALLTKAGPQRARPLLPLLIESAPFVASLQQPAAREGWRQAVTKLPEELGKPYVGRVQAALKRAGRQSPGQ